MIALANLLGLLGLLGVVALIIIYVIKPNYQQKFISSTYVWKLSLKYNKRKINVNKLMNLLLIICQVLILISCALILAQPVIRAQGTDKSDERVIIIESSVNMLATDGVQNDANDPDGTRFKRAVIDVRKEVESVFEKDTGKVTIIMAGKEAEFLKFDSGNVDNNGNTIYTEVNRLTNLNKTEVLARLDELDNSDCTYGSADISGALELAGGIVERNSNSRVMLYTATEYKNSNNVEVMSDKVRFTNDKGQKTEWNAAILDGKATLNENYVYSFTVDIGLYIANGNVDGNVNIVFDIEGANAVNKYDGVEEDEIKGRHVIYYMKPVQVVSDVASDKYKVVTVTLNTHVDSLGLSVDNIVEDKPLYKDSTDITDGGGKYQGINNFKSVHVYIESVDRNDGSGGTSTVDSLPYDDDFYFFDGNKPMIKVLYASTVPNPFVKSVIAAWRSTLAPIWNIDITELQAVDDSVIWSEKTPNTGYDLYIYETTIPREVPSDGASIFLVPRQLPSGAGVSIGQNTDIESDEEYSFSVADHPLAAHLANYEQYILNRYRPLTSRDEDCEEILSLVKGEDNQTPIAMVKNKPYGKMFVLGMDLHYSDIEMYADFSLMFLDLFNEFFVPVVPQFAYEIGDTVALRSMGSAIGLSFQGGETETIEYEQLPYTINLDRPGTYTVSQTLLSSEEIISNFYVKMPGSESNIVQEVEELEIPYNIPDPNKIAQDLLLYFAAVLVALLFAEWLLHSRNQF